MLVGQFLRYRPLIAGIIHAGPVIVINEMDGRELPAKSQRRDGQGDKESGASCMFRFSHSYRVAKPEIHPITANDGAFSRIEKLMDYRGRDANRPSQ